MKIRRRSLFIGLAVLAIAPACLCTGLTEGLVPTTGGGGGEAPGPVVSGSCDSRAAQVEVGQSYTGQIDDATGLDYPANCTYFCVYIPDGSSQLSVGISDYNVDLDLYVGYGAFESVFGEDIEESNTYWESNAAGTSDETINISNPASDSAYYVEVCSWDGLASDFTLNTSAN